MLGDGGVKYQFQGTSTAESPDAEMATTHMTLRVNRDTHLPFVWTTRSSAPRSHPACRLRSITPSIIRAEGPARFYDLGVPKSAAIVDRVPEGKLADVLEKMASEVREFDPYYAVVVHGNDTVSLVAVDDGLSCLEKWPPLRT